MKRSTLNRLKGALSAFTGPFPPPFKPAVAKRLEEANARAEEEGISTTEALQKGMYEHIQGQLVSVAWVGGSVGSACYLVAHKGYSWHIAVLGCLPLAALIVLSVVVFIAERNEKRTSR